MSMDEVHGVSIIVGMLAGAFMYWCWSREEYYGEQKLEIRKLKALVAEKERELQQIREHEFQNGYREAEAIWEEKYQEVQDFLKERKS